MITKRSVLHLHAVSFPYPAIDSDQQWYCYCSCTHVNHNFQWLYKVYFHFMLLYIIHFMLLYTPAGSGELERECPISCSYAYAQFDRIKSHSTSIIFFKRETIEIDWYWITFAYVLRLLAKFSVTAARPMKNSGMSANEKFGIMGLMGTGHTSTKNFSLVQFLSVCFRLFRFRENPQEVRKT